MCKQSVNSDQAASPFTRFLYGARHFLENFYDRKTIIVSRLARERTYCVTPFINIEHRSTLATRNPAAGIDPVDDRSWAYE